MVDFTIAIICLDEACWSPHDAIRAAYDYIRTTYDLKLAMHAIIGTTHVHIKMNIRVLVITITPS